MATSSTMASETNLPLRPKPKGILKKPTAPPPGFTAPPPSTSPLPSLKQQDQDQNLNQDNQPPLTRAEILHKQEQAARLRLLQTLRDTELKPPIPLETFELLSNLPQTPSHPASAPSPADTSLFLHHLRDFQPSEYLDLIEERNCLNKCGYTLCPRPRRTHAGPFKLSAGSQSGIARTADLNKWCSDACALRALHLKVQLDNPSYVRSGEGKMVVKLELREEKAKDGGSSSAGTASTATSATTAPRGSEEDRNQLAQAMAQLEIDKRKQQAAKKGAALADERGDGGVFTGVSRVEVTIKENAADGPVLPPTLESVDAQLIEGYKPTLGKGKKPEARQSTGSDDDDDDDFFTVRF